MEQGEEGEGGQATSTLCVRRGHGGGRDEQLGIHHVMLGGQQSAGRIDAPHRCTRRRSMRIVLHHMAHRVRQQHLARHPTTEIVAAHRCCGLRGR